MMKKKSWLLCAILCFAYVFVIGCGFEQKTTDETALPASSPVQTEAREESAAETNSYIAAEEDFGNLRADSAEIPVYDRYTLAERRAKGFPTELPQIPPYREKKTAYLTFDDGPENVNTPAILDILQREKVKATFYVVGRAVQQYPQMAERIFREGHGIGNHSYDHDYGRLYASMSNYLEEMEETDSILHELLGVRPLITRSPGGRSGNLTKGDMAVLAANGYAEHDWNVTSADSAPNHPVAQDFIDNISEQAVMDSAIILMHCSAGHEETVKALPEIIRVLRERGYSFGVVTPMTPQPW